MAQAREIQIRKKDGTVLRFVSSLADHDARNVCLSMVDSTFAQKMACRSDEEGNKWRHKIASEFVADGGTVPDDASMERFPRLVKTLTAAKVAKVNGQEVYFDLRPEGGRSKYAGCVSIGNGVPFGDDPRTPAEGCEFYGMILPSGELARSGKYDAGTRVLLRELEAGRVQILQLDKLPDAKPSNLPTKAEGATRRTARTQTANTSPAPVTVPQEVPPVTPSAEKPKRTKEEKAARKAAKAAKKVAQQTAPVVVAEEVTPLPVVAEEEVTAGPYRVMVEEVTPPADPSAPDSDGMTTAQLFSLLLERSKKDGITKQNLFDAINKKF